MKRLLCFCLFFSKMVCAQNNKGIVFEKNVTWKQILQQARSQYKFILLEVSRNPCQECVTMDANVYALEDIGTLAKRDLLSLKINLDTTGNSFVPGCPVYEASFQDLYKVNKKPAYLFFSPDGKIVHKSVGPKSPNDFIKLILEATMPGSQYYPGLTNYFTGTKDYPELGNLAVMARSIGDEDTAKLIAADFIKNYLDRLPDSLFCTAGNIDFLRRFMDIQSTKERFFQLCFYRPELIDRETSKGIADNIVRDFINREEIDSKLWYNGKAVKPKPNWIEIDSSIQKKFGRSYSKDLVFQAKMNFYRIREDFQNFAQAFDDWLARKLPQFGEGLGSDPWNLNVKAWDVFLHCTDTAVLIRALDWSNLSLQLDPSNLQFLDTKANLLYKLGRVDEAIHLENKAIQMGIMQAKLAGDPKGYFYDDYTVNIEKMKKGQPTWKTK